MLVRRTAQRLAVAVTALAVLSACSSSGGGTSGSPTGSGSTSGQASSGPSIAELASQKPALPALPTVSATPGKSVWIITCGLAAAGCAFLSNNIQSVMQDQLKWKVNNFDGKLTPATYSVGINQAIAAHADAIVLVAIDCALVKPALQQAKAAGVPVIDIAGYDCSDPSQGGGESLITVSDPGGSLTTSNEAAGKALADYVAVQSNGSAQMVLATLPDFAYANTALAAFKKELPIVCPGCKVLAEAPATGTDLVGGTAAAKFSSALLQQPSANYVVATQEVQLSYISNALRTSSKKVTLLSQGGSLPDEIQLIKNGTLQGMMAQDIAMQAWTTTDFVVRSLAKVTTVPVPPNSTLVDKDHNLPASGGFTSTIGYQASYEKSWGVG